jgi:hypothetical protein
MPGRDFGTMSLPGRTSYPARRIETPVPSATRNLGVWQGAGARTLVGFGSSRSRGIPSSVRRELGRPVGSQTGPEEHEAPQQRGGCGLTLLQQLSEASRSANLLAEAIDLDKGAHTMSDTVTIPSKAVGEGTDLVIPTRDLLQALNLIGTDQDIEDAGKVTAIFSGPPQSVALIEAGATAASKWWSAGLGVTAIGLWTSVATFWSAQDTVTQRVVLAGASLFAAVVVLAIAHLLASDIRGRAAATVAVVQARAAVAHDMVSAAQATYTPPIEAPQQPSVTPLASQLKANFKRADGADEEGWLAVALVTAANGDRQYLIVKDDRDVVVPVEDLRFLPA